MPRYDLLFSRELETGARLLHEGETFEYCGELWRVEKVERDGAVRPRVYLVQTSDDAVPDSGGTPENGEAPTKPERRPGSPAARPAPGEAPRKAPGPTVRPPTP